MPEVPTYSAFLVHVDVKKTSAGRLKLAAGLAARFDARLIGVAAEEFILPYYGDMSGYVDAGIVDLERKRIDDDLKGAEKLFNAAMGAKIKSEWRAATARPEDWIVRQARAVDIAIMGKPAAAKSGGSLGAMPGEVVMQAGRPLLIVPQGVSALAASSIVIAWKDTREARRAVLDAMPLLVRAEQVVIAVAGTESADDGADDVLRLIQGHGVVKAAVRRAKKGPSASGELMKVADQVGADLIVAGAYGHSRAREWAFGGVTAELLEQAKCCCLLSH